MFWIFLIGGRREGRVEMSDTYTTSGGHGACVPGAFGVIANTMFLHCWDAVFINDVTCADQDWTLLCLSFLA